jgi:hypothetical protein
MLQDYQNNGMDRDFQFCSYSFGPRFRERASRLTSGATVRILPPKTTLLFVSLLLCAAAPLSAEEILMVRPITPACSKCRSVVSASVSWRRPITTKDRQSAMMPQQTALRV